MKETGLIAVFWGLIAVGFIGVAIKCWKSRPWLGPIRFWFGFAALVVLAILFIVAASCALCVALP